MYTFKCNDYRLKRNFLSVEKADFHAFNPIISDPTNLTENMLPFNGKMADMSNSVLRRVESHLRARKMQKK